MEKEKIRDHRIKHALTWRGRKMRIGKRRQKEKNVEDRERTRQNAEEEVETGPSSSVENYCPIVEALSMFLPESRGVSRGAASKAFPANPGCILANRSAIHRRPGRCCA